MRLKLAVVVLGMLLAMGLLAAPAVSGNGMNQGDKNLVLKVDNGLVSCDDPESGAKIQGGLGRTIEFWADDPIDFVTVKSGENAKVVSYAFDMFWGTITLSKDVSTYVVWTCPKEETEEGGVEPPTEDGGLPPGLPEYCYDPDLDALPLECAPEQFS